MSKTIKCPVCFYHEALLENESAAPNTPEYIGAIYCPACESSINNLDEPLDDVS
ncbi:hypothetical protein [Photorhabdus sp. RM96S]|uniref:hypothetical protein n=1 Tax=Photorhabdus sp. RM96S TaxID=3342822 RepID=UPI0036DDEC5D